MRALICFVLIGKFCFTQNLSQFNIRSKVLEKIILQEGDNLNRKQFVSKWDSQFDFCFEYGGIGSIDCNCINDSIYSKYNIVRDSLMTEFSMRKKIVEQKIYSKNEMIIWIFNPIEGWDFINNASFEKTIHIPVFKWIKEENTFYKYLYKFNLDSNDQINIEIDVIK